MKKVVLALLLVLLVGSVSAHGHSGYYRGRGWGPIIGGAVVGAVIYDIYHPVVVQQPVVIQQQPIILQQGQTCSPWTETQHPNGSFTKTRTCSDSTQFR